MPERGETRPTVALLVEPRLLRDSLARVLAKNAVVIHLPDGNDEAGAAPRCDIVVTSTEPGGLDRDATVVLRLWDGDSGGRADAADVAGRRVVDARALEDVVAAIDAWTAGGTRTVAG